MEAERLLVVVEQVPQRADDRWARGRRLSAQPVPEVAVVGERTSRSRSRGRRRPSTQPGQQQPAGLVEERVPPRAPYPGRAAGARLPEEHQQRERRHEEERAPLHRASRSRAGRRPPAATTAQSPAGPAAGRRGRAGSGRARPPAPAASAVAGRPGRAPARRTRRARRSSRKMSSSAVRDSTRWNPSSAISRPAAQPSTVERNIRRAMRTSSTDRVPTTPPSRQPNSARCEECPAPDAVARRL